MFESMPECIYHDMLRATQKSIEEEKAEAGKASSS
jgi:hypothetical protein